MFIKTNTALNYEGYKIDKNRLIQSQLEKRTLAPSNITEEELLKRRAINHFQQVKDIALNPENIEKDLLMSSHFKGLTFMKSDMNLTPDLLLKETEFNQPELTDPQFIQNFIIKEAFYRDQINENFSGEELTKRLEQLEHTINQSKEKLATLYSKSVGRFFNNEESWLYNDNPLLQAYEHENTSKTFNVETFKEHVLDMMGRQSQELQTIKAKHKDKWKTMIETGGRHIDFFQKELGNSISLNHESTDQTMEKMNFRDMEEIGSLISGLGKGISTNSDGYLGAYLGQMQTKTSLFLYHSQMSDSIKERVKQVVGSKVDIKMKWTKLSPEIHHRMDRDSSTDWMEQVRSIMEKIDINEILSRENRSLEQNYQRFRSVESSSFEQFCSNYMKGLNSLQQDLGRDSFAIGVSDTLAQDWNRFVRMLPIDHSQMESLFVPTLNFSVMDERV